MKWLLALALVSSLITTMAIAQTDKPAASSESWEFDFDLNPIQAIQIKLPGQDESQVYWFIRYTVVNRSGADQIFVPEFMLYTDQGQMIPAGKGVPPTVYTKVKELFSDPMLQDQTAITGKLLQGEDNGKSGVAIFRAFDESAGDVHVFVGGLSGQTSVLKLPEPITVTELDAKGNKTQVTKDKVILSRTLDLHYKFTGDPNNKPHSERLRLVGKEWIMR